MLYLRVNAMNHDFVHIFRFLRPVGGFVELLKILHVDVQAAAAMDVTSGKYLSEGAAREWSTVVIVIVIFMT